MHSIDDVAGTAGIGAMRPAFRSPASMLSAKSVALVGASERGRWPGRIFTNLAQFGYPGRIYLVNPRQSEVFGERCYPSLQDPPQAPDHALVIVPAKAVAE